MPTRRSGVTFWPRKTPPSCVVNQLCGSWRRWKSSIAPAADDKRVEELRLDRARRRPRSPRAVTRKSAIVDLVEGQRVLAQRLVAALRARRRRCARRRRGSRRRLRRCGPGRLRSGAVLAQASIRRIMSASGPFRVAGGASSPGLSRFYRESPTSASASSSTRGSVRTAAGLPTKRAVDCEHLADDAQLVLAQRGAGGGDVDDLSRRGRSAAPARCCRAASRSRPARPSRRSSACVMLGYLVATRTTPRCAQRARARSAPRPRGSATTKRQPPKPRSTSSTHVEARLRAARPCRAMRAVRTAVRHVDRDVGRRADDVLDRRACAR